MDTSQLKRTDDCESIYSLNPLYLQLNHASRYIKETNGNKYLTLDDSVNENKEVLKNCTDLWTVIKNKIKAINDDKENDYEKDYMKINLILTMTYH